MFFRFLGISFLKFVVSMAAIFGLYSLLPESLSGPIALIPAWAIAFVLAFVFATWAYGKNAPRRQEMLILVVIWMTMTVSGFLLYGMILSPRGAGAAVAPELLIQFALEAVAIILAGYRLRRHTVESILGV